MKSAGRTETCVGISILFILGAIAAGVFAIQSRYDPAFFTSVLLKSEKTAPAEDASSSEAESAPRPPFLPEGLAPMGPGETFDSATLSDKIDGKAELYLASGFVRLSTWRFSRRADPKIWLELFVYDMGDPRNAFSVYSVQKRQEAEKAGFATFAYKSENALFFVNGSKYYEIIAVAADMEKEMFSLAENLVRAEPGTASRSAEPSLFPPESLDEASIALHMSDVFGFSGLDRVYTAAYRVEGQSVTAFVSRRDSPEVSAGLAEAYGRFLLENGARDLGEVPGVPGSRLFLVFDTYEVVLRRGSVLAGVHEAENRESAERVAVLLSRKLDESANE